MALQDSEDDRFTGGAAPLFSANTAGAKIGFIDFNLAGLRVMKIHMPGRS